jgi:hypothetical protein
LVVPVLDWETHQKSCLVLAAGNGVQSGSTIEDGSMTENGKLNTLSAVEDVVNQYAEKIASRYQIPKEKFRINLVTSCKGVMQFRRGPIAQIDLLWPAAQPDLNTLLNDVFKTISRKRLLECVAVERVSHIRSRNLENKKWTRELFGDEADLITDLIPRNRLEVSTVTTITVRDRVTGISYEITESTKNQPYYLKSVEPWLKISRMVHDAEEVVEVVEAVTDTPMLDEVKLELMSND